LELDRYTDRCVFHIQRGCFEDAVELKDVDGLDSIIHFDYMGAAEYEFRSLPSSLRKIVRLYRKRDLEKAVITVLDEEFVLLIDKNSPYTLEDIQTVLTSFAKEEWSKSSWRVKMGCHLGAYFKGRTLTELKKGCKKKTVEIRNYAYCNFWWDIDNNWFLFPQKENYLQLVYTALQKLVDRKFDKA
jgi:hypothetical protein